MKDSKLLLRELEQIDGKGYKAYKDIEGKYKFDKYILSIEHVQGDPFAAPSRIRIIIEQKYAKFPLQYFNENHKRIAVVDFLTRLVYKNINKYYDKVNGSGKSGVLAIDNCDQEILDRTSIYINNDRVEARLEVGLPAAGRRILAKQTKTIFFDVMPIIVEQSLFFKNTDKKALINHIKLVEDQNYIRKQLKRKNICSFIANGSILPRESGISTKPLKKQAVPFKSPKSLEIELNLPNEGIIKGMAIPNGITLIVGGGYHGKSTILKALELGVYNHIKGDGREFVITNDSAVKVRAEDGRKIEKVDISLFINNLPNGKSTKKFSSENASGSTSEAANIVEALEGKTKLLLIDEDTSATNFMIRDKKMQKLVSVDKEPITPFINRVRSLYINKDVSTILVVGSSGDYFNVADTVIMMDEYKPIDVTKVAKQIADNKVLPEVDLDSGEINMYCNRVVLNRSFPENYKGVKVKINGMHTILYNKITVDLKSVEQIVDISQTNAIGEIFKYIKNNVKDEEMTLTEIVDKVYKVINEKGLDYISSKKGHPGRLALPRKHEIASALNRFRELRIK
ncbi:ABC-ATPase domain-containing protein [Clostridium aestuarii]|uniref:ABC-ATPase domain-containing protein n=1 Tax=Clostridium aestuarii TaxID=338193 RepID=A0ABT4D228_9CLOT|nr:ABC-ATPase domain-containing protein [Clostridium aestuarii]